MKIQQQMLSCLKEWKEISGLDFCLLDIEDSIVASTSDSIRQPDSQVLEDFRLGSALCISDNKCQIRKVRSDSGQIHLLIVSGHAESAPTIGELAVCQVRTILNAYAEKNDRGLFIRNLLLDQYPAGDIPIKARKLHIDDPAERFVFLVETHSRTDSNISEVLRNIFSHSGRLLLTELDEKTLALVLERPGNLQSPSQTAAMIADMLNSEAMIPVWVSCSKPTFSLAQLSNGYREARTAIEIGRIFYPDRSVFDYESLGIGRLIYQLPPDICEIFLDEFFHEESLDSLDAETMSTIRTFFENNLNLSETSRQLYVHRNTLVYRFEKLQKRFGLDIRTFEDAMTFKLAMMVSDYVKYKRNSP